MVTNPYLGLASQQVFEPKTIQKIVNFSTKSFQLKKHRPTKPPQLQLLPNCKFLECLHKNELKKLQTH
jgi:hypothetical protein